MHGERKTLDVNPVSELAYHQCSMRTASHNEPPRARDFPKNIANPKSTMIGVSQLEAVYYQDIHTPSMMDSRELNAIKLEKFGIPSMLHVVSTTIPAAPLARP